MSSPSKRTISSHQSAHVNVWSHLVVRVEVIMECSHVYGIISVIMLVEGSPQSLLFEGEKEFLFTARKRTAVRPSRRPN